MLQRVFKAFQYRDFRLMWLGACTSSIGTWMQKLAQSWLVLQISNDPAMLGIDSFLGQIPIFLFSLFGGVVADRQDRRLLLIGSQIVQMTCAFILAGLMVIGLTSVWPIFALSFITGLAQAFGGPAYQALIPRLVQPQDLPNAIALNSIQFNLARVIGPAIGGVAMLKMGAPWCFTLNGLSFIAVIISLLMLRERFVPTETRQSIFESMNEGFAFIKSKPGMRPLIALAFLMTFLGLPLLDFLPIFARDVFHREADTFAVLLSISGMGAVAGALLVAAVGHIKQKGRLTLIVISTLGVLMVGFAASNWLPLSYVVLFLCSAAMISCFAMISSLVQLITNDSMRGRVMSVYNVAFRGGMPIGSLAAGYMVKMFSAPYVIAANGVLLVFLGLYFLLVQRRVASLQ